MCVKDHGTHMSPAGHNENCRQKFYIDFHLLRSFHHFIDGVEEDTGNNRDIKGHTCLHCQLAMHQSIYIIKDSLFITHFALKFSMDWI